MIAFDEYNEDLKKLSSSFSCGNKHIDNFLRRSESLGKWEIHLPISMGRWISQIDYMLFVNPLYSLNLCLKYDILYVWKIS